MSDLSTLVFLMGSKASLILGLIATLTYAAGARWPRECIAGHRVGITALLALPLFVLFVPMMEFPVLTPVPTKNDTTVPTVLSVVPTLNTANDAETFWSEPPIEVADAKFEPSMDAASSRVAATLPPPALSPTETVVPNSIEPEPENASRSQHDFRFAVMGLALLYGLVFCVLVIRLLTGWIGLARLRQAGMTLTDSDWQTRLAFWSKLQGVRRPVQLLVSETISIPMTFGWRKPVILIPQVCVSACDSSQRDAVLIHELTHILRGDFFWQLVTRLTSAVYWVHPLVWLVRLDSEALRERVCDLICARQLGRERYAQALVQIASRVTMSPRMALGMAMAQRSSLRRRVDELCSERMESHRRGGRAVASLVCVIVTLLMGIVVVGQVTHCVPAAKEVPPPIANLEERSDLILTNDNGGISIQAAGANGVTGGVAFSRGSGVLAGDESAPVLVNSGSYSIFMAGPSQGVVHQIALSDGGTIQRPLDISTTSVSDLSAASPGSVGNPFNTISVSADQVHLHAYRGLDGSEIIQATFSPNDLEQETLQFNQQIAATVNGIHIRNGDVLAKYALELKRLRTEIIKNAQSNTVKIEMNSESGYSGQRLTTKVAGNYEKRLNDYLKVRESYIQREIPISIQNSVMTYEMIGKTTPAQQAVLLEKAMNQLRDHLSKLKKQMNARSTDELNLILQEYGTDLEFAREQFMRERLAYEYIEMNCLPKLSVEDSEIRRFYDSHQEQFFVPMMTDWQRVCVPFSDQDDRDVAKAKLESALAELSAGRSLDDDQFIPNFLPDSGFYKQKFTRTRVDDIKSDELKLQLATASVNQWSPIVEASGMWSVTRVTQRTDSRTKSMDEVEPEIREAILLAKSTASARPFIKKVMSEAKITTKYTLPEYWFNDSVE